VGTRHFRRLGVRHQCGELPDPGFAEHRIPLAAKNQHRLGQAAKQRLRMTVFLLQQDPQ
jgi:hypothetical protein